MAGEAEAIGEVEVEVTEGAREAAAPAAAAPTGVPSLRVKAKPGQMVPAHQDTPPTHQKAAVTATTNTAPTLGTVPSPPPAPG